MRMAAVQALPDLASDMGTRKEWLSLAAIMQPCAVHLKSIVI